MLKELLVFMFIVAARLPVMVISSAVALPSVTCPLAVSVPPTVSADMIKSFVPSEVPLIMSVKFWLTCVALAVVPFVNVLVTVIAAMVHPLGVTLYFYLVLAF